VKWTQSSFVSRISYPGFFGLFSLLRLFSLSRLTKQTKETKQTRYTRLHASRLRAGLSAEGFGPQAEALQRAGTRCASRASMAMRAGGDQPGPPNPTRSAS
jgi:hypothetical protein